MSIDESDISRPADGLSRRRFLRAASGGGMAALGLSVAGTLLPRSPAAGVTHPAALAAPPESWNPLRHMPPVRADDLTLHAAVTTVDVGAGESGTAWLLNDSLPSPFIRVKRGDRFRAILENALPDPLILHWHGLTPPEPMDGHPRLAIGTGRRYEYDFTVDNRAGTYWYHSHSHYRVGKHAYLGVAGMLIVDDEAEDAPALPSGEREIPLILQDRRVDDAGIIVPYGIPDTMEGLIGNEPFGNGVNRPELEVDAALYRFRILNGSNARIFRLARDDAKNLYIIGNDAGLLERTAAVPYVDIAPGERIDALVDLRDARPGEVVMLGSRSFMIENSLSRPEEYNRQGRPMELMRLKVTRRAGERLEIPARLSARRGPEASRAVRERTFTLTSNRDTSTRTMMAHQINGVSYRMGRVDEQVPFGDTEIWSFVNENNFSHPMHLHATHFRVLSRHGGRDRVMPWEAGLKDTVLVHPGETVRVAVRFEAHRGLFLLHCHNLEHEDTGMMLNVEVV